MSSLAGLEQDKSQSPTLVYIRNGAPSLSEYDNFMIGSVQVDTRGKDAKKLDPKDIDRVVTYFTKQLTKELQEGGYSVVDKAAEKTMEMSFVLSGIKTPSAAPNVTLLVFPLVLSVGGITVEGTFKDAMSDRIDAVAINSSEGSRFLNNSPWSTWEDVESSLDQWTKGIRESIDNNVEGK